MRFAVVALVLTGCLDSSVVVCGDGRVCPAGQVCDDAHQRCVLPSQVSACKGMDDGTTCTTTGSPGVCSVGVCLPIGCGDGIKSGSEQCDLTVPDTLDECTEHDFQSGGAVTCTDDCLFDFSQCNGYCGDGIVSGNEACDYQLETLGKTCLDFGFYQPGGLACTAACTFDTSACQQRCGDGVRNGQESCDGTDFGGSDCTDAGFYNAANLKCTSACTFDVSSCTGRCGDGVRNGQELCDGTDLGGQDCIDLGYYNATTLKCNSLCSFDTTMCTGRCGDGIRNGQESCDGTDLGGDDCTDLGYYNSDTLACNSACSFNTNSCSGYCGDRVKTTGKELCDGQVPAGLSCVGLGYAQGAIGCSALCVPELAGCSAPEEVPWPTATNLAAAQTLKDMWAASPTNMIVVGGQGTFPWTAYIAHGNGTTWTAATGLGGALKLNAVWGANASNVFAVGDGGTILRYNGSTWSTMTSAMTADIYDVWGTAANDVYAVGASSGGETIFHYNGSSWSPMTPPASGAQLNGVYGASGKLWVVADNGSLYKYDSSWTEVIWTTLAPGSRPRLNGVWAASDKEIYLAGEGMLAYYNGTNWVTSPDSSKNFTAVIGTGSGDVYVSAWANTIRHFDGVSWHAMTAAGGGNFYGIGAAGPREIYTFGSGGQIARFTADGWARQAVQGIYGIYDLYSVGSTQLEMAGVQVRETPGGLADKDSLNNSFSGLQDIGGDGTNTFMVAYNGKIYRRTAPLTWTPMTSPTANNLYSVSGIYAAGAGTILKYNGSAWTAMTSPTTDNVSMVWSPSPTVAWAISNDKIYELTGTTWTESVHPVLTTGLLYAIWGTAPNDVFAVGSAGDILHYDGVAWSKMVSPTNKELMFIDGTGPTDVYAASNSTDVFHYDGLAWAPIEIPQVDQVESVYGSKLGVGTAVLERRRYCAATETSCTDGADNDCDGKYDCGDPDCSGSCGAGACAAATTLACGSSIMGTTIGASNLLSQYACDPFTEHGPEVMYKHVATANGTVSVQLSAARDLDLVVITQGAGGSCETRNPSCKAASSQLGGSETVTFPVTSGTTYYVIVEGFGRNEGAYTLDVSCF